MTLKTIKKPPVLPMANCWTHGLTNSLGCLHGYFSRPQSMSFDRFLTRWAAARPDPTSPSLYYITKSITQKLSKYGIEQR